MTDDDLSRLQQAVTEEERLRVESELLEQSDNRPHDLDPLQPEELP